MESLRASNSTRRSRKADLWLDIHACGKQFCDINTLLHKPALLLAALGLASLSIQPAEQPLSFNDWKAACAPLPFNRSLQGRLPPREQLPLPQFADFDQALTAFLKESAQGPLAQRPNWVGAFPEASFFDPEAAYFLKPPRPPVRQAGQPPAPFQPFAQSLNVPAGSRVYLRADLHGDIHSLIANLTWLNAHGYLTGFQIARPDFFMIFLGDYTDRGVYGMEVLFTLYRLKLQNPNHVFLLRGNHEEASLQARYGLLAEGAGKYGAAFDARKVLRAYDFLPVVLYLGSGADVIQCNHGGMEPGYSPHALLEAEGAVRFQLLGTLNQRQFFLQHPEWFAKSDPASRDLARRVLRNFTPDDPNSPSVLGFLWNDFTVLSSEQDFSFDPGRAFVYGQRATQFLLERAGTTNRMLRAVFRGHQHSSVLNPIMRRLVASRGVFQHWQSSDSEPLLNAPVAELARKIDSSLERRIEPGSVWTFNVGPESAYGAGCGFDFDAFGILTTAEHFADWRLQIVNLPVAR